MHFGEQQLYLYLDGGQPCRQMFAKCLTHVRHVYKWVPLNLRSSMELSAVTSCPLGIVDEEENNEGYHKDHCC